MSQKMNKYFLIARMDLKFKKVMCIHFFGSILPKMYVDVILTYIEMAVM